MVNHNIDPIYNKNSIILILGSFPSVKSREAKFFYHHPRNRFWKILEILYGVKFNSIEDKKNLLLEKNIALWDVIESCDIVGSSDSSIKNVKVNDIDKIIKSSQIKYIITNGKKAEQLYNKYLIDQIKIKSINLPSTSPANATYNLNKLLEEWKIIKDLTTK